MSQVCVRGVHESGVCEGGRWVGASEAQQLASPPRCMTQHPDVHDLSILMRMTQHPDVSHRLPESLPTHTHTPPPPPPTPNTYQL